ncbi:ISAs1 family transposase [Mycobacterium helveticum]|uniref:ISAs1 family transposase n=1 Tax=Mycobacterium helveticum TaxID=2592811 RepID=UPI00143D3FA7|nr:ISAs1 family transposase [Mycobacterium helveticum]
MPSSPTLPAETNTTRHEPLLAVLQRVPGPRDRRGVRYWLAGVLALAVTATVAGCRSFAAIGQWAAETAADKLACFGFTSGSVPDESTLRKLFARVDADALDRALGTWMWTRTFTVEQRRVIALDGKTVRGARTRPDGKAPHLVAAFDHGAGAVLGQVGIDAKSNEIPAVRTLLGQFDLDGAVVTLDAMHTQTDTATAITGAGGD